MSRGEGGGGQGSGDATIDCADDCCCCRYHLGEVAVSWHADSSLQPHSTIGVYQVSEDEPGGQDWRVAVRVGASGAAVVQKAKSKGKGDRGKQVKESFCGHLWGQAVADCCPSTTHNTNSAANQQQQTPKLCLCA